MTITNWECNATVPAIRYIPSIIEFLGYDPLPKIGSLCERMTNTRKVLGLSQRKLAEMLSIDSATLQSWEAGSHRPSSKNLKSISQIFDLT